MLSAATSLRARSNLATLIEVRPLLALLKDLSGEMAATGHEFMHET